MGLVISQFFAPFGATRISITGLSNVSGIVSMVYHYTTWNWFAFLLPVWGPIMTLPLLGGAFEISRGKGTAGRYRFPVVLLTTTGTHTRRHFSEIVVAPTGKNDWVVDKLP